MLAPVDIGRLAGLIDGEGSMGMWDRTRNGHRHQIPWLLFLSTDVDLVTWVGSHIHGRFSVRGPRGRLSKKPIYCTRVQGSRAIGVMMTIYLLVCLRRQQRIRDVIEAWRSTPSPPGQRGRVWKETYA